jgi:hypothetical protein
VARNDRRKADIKIARECPSGDIASHLSQLLVVEIPA